MRDAVRDAAPIATRRALMLATAVVAAALASPPGRAAAQVHDGESAPAAAWRKAMETGDLAALARMHDARTIAFPPDQMEVRGADAIMRGYASLFARYTLSVKVEDAHWTGEWPLVVSWGLTTLTLHPKAGGADVVTRTRFTDAAVSTRDGWRYVVDHASIPSAK